MKVLKIVILESDNKNRQNILSVLQETSNSHSIKLADNINDFTDCLGKFTPDIILAGYHLTTEDHYRAFNYAHTEFPAIPFVVISDPIGDDKAVALIKKGVNDYILRQNLGQLPDKLAKAVDEAAESKQKAENIPFEGRAHHRVSNAVVDGKAESESIENYEHLRNLLESVTDGFLAIDRDWIVRYYNKEAENILIPRDQIINRNIWDVFPDAVPSRFYTEYHRVMEQGVRSSFEEYYVGLNIWVGITAYPSKDGISVLFRDITDTKRLESLTLLEKQVLELYTRRGTAIDDAIGFLFTGIKSIHPDLTCSLQNLCDSGSLEMRRSSKSAAFEVADVLKFKKFGTQADKDFPAAGPGSAISYSLWDTDQKVTGILHVSLPIERALSRTENLTIEKARNILQHLIKNDNAEQALIDSEEKYHNLFHLSPLPMWVYDPDTYRFLKVNDAAIRHYGYSADEFMSMTIKDIRPCDGMTSLQNIVRISKQKQRLYQGTHDHLKKNGELIKVLIQSNLIAFGDKAARIVLVTDITEKVKFENDLKLSEKRFKALVQEGSDLINVIDLQGKYKYANPASAALLGLNPEEITGINAIDFIHEDDKEMILQALSSIVKANRVETLPYRFQDKNGEYRWLQSIGTNLLDDASVNGIIVNSRDITDSMNYIHAIEEQNAKLQDIAWIQSHMVRAPLSRIMGLIDLIKNYPDDEKVTKEFLDHILSSAYELDNVIRSIVRTSERAEKMSNVPKKQDI